MSETPTAPVNEAAPTTDETMKAPEAKKEPVPIVWRKKARIEWLDDAGAVTETQECLRSTAELLQMLAGRLKDKPESETSKLRIVVDAEDDQPKNDDGSTASGVIAEGDLKSVMVQLMRVTIPPPYVLLEYQRMTEFMSARSSLKGLMVTFVFGDAQAGGFAFMSTVSDVTNEDIITLAEAAKNQIGLYKDNMKQRDPLLKFPDETGGIITPDQFRGRKR